MTEIERKYLLKPGNTWQPVVDGIEIRQGYLTVDSERSVRVRIAGEKAFLTIKGKITGISRPEMEYEIPVSDAEILLGMCINSIIEKIRYKIRLNSHIWEVDVFKGENTGLIIAEIELENESQQFEIPDWIGEEVTSDRRFYNSYLSQNPYSKWN